MTRGLKLRPHKGPSVTDDEHHCRACGIASTPQGSVCNAPFNLGQIHRLELRPHKGPSVTWFRNRRRPNRSLLRPHKGPSVTFLQLVDFLVQVVLRPHKGPSVTGYERWRDYVWRPASTPQGSVCNRHKAVYC